MPLSITSLNSGSNGNCYYVGNEEEAILVDAGISCRETEKRLQRLQLSIGKIKAVFVSHEHSDHIRGLPVLAKKYHLPVYITPQTLHHGRLQLPSHLVVPLVAERTVQIGRLAITAFPKFHDAADPHSFVVTDDTVKVGIFTDIGTPCDNLINHFSTCHAAFLEANYDDVMLDNGHYPYHLKQRIRGSKGHLSNAQALNLFTTYKPAHMSHLLLAHLSKNNNCPNLVKELFTTHAAGTQVIVASRYAETPVYTITSSHHILPLTQPKVIPKKVARSKANIGIQQEIIW